MSSKPLFRIASLNAAQDRTTFNSGSEPLDHYFKQQVTQDVRRRVTACFVALTHEETIAGYYTLASASLELADLRRTLKKTATLSFRSGGTPGTLGVAQPFQGQGLGGALLVDALARSCRAEIAAYALIVDAKNAAAVAFVLSASRLHCFAEWATDVG